MGEAFTTAFIKHYEHDIVEMFAYIALDGSSDVLGVANPNAPVGTGPNTLGKGLTASIGPSVTTQPHTGTGEYQFKLDQPWQALLGAEVMPKDATGNVLKAYVDANVRANNSGAYMGVDPGTDSSIANQTVRVRFRGTTGTLTNPPANGGFWLRLVLKRTAIR